MGMTFPSAPLGDYLLTEVLRQTCYQKDRARSIHEARFEIRSA